MNQTHSTDSNEVSITISSKQLLDHVDSTLVNLSRVVSIEERVTTEVALDIVRKHVSQKHYALMNDADKNKIAEVLREVENKIKNGAATEFDRKLLKVFRLLGF